MKAYISVTVTHRALQIEEAIHELDEKKNEALKKAYEQVTRDFGSIFSMLLPGTTAKLSPVEGQSILQGLEVKVCTAYCWSCTVVSMLLGCLWRCVERQPFGAFGRSAV